MPNTIVIPCLGHSASSRDKAPLPGLDLRETGRIFQEISRLIGDVRGTHDEPLLQPGYGSECDGRECVMGIEPL